MQMSHEVVVRPEVEEIVPALTGGERLASFLLTLVRPVTRLISRFPWAFGGFIVGLLLVTLRLGDVDDDCTPMFCGEVYAAVAFGMVMIWQREDDVSCVLSLRRSLVVAAATFVPFGVWAIFA